MGNSPSEEPGSDFNSLELVELLVVHRLNWKALQLLHEDSPQLEETKGAYNRSKGTLSGKWSYTEYAIHRLEVAWKSQAEKVALKRGA